MRPILFLIGFILLLAGTFCLRQAVADQSPLVSFGESGKFKMLYDCRQRPQSVFLKGRLYVVYNGDATPTKNQKGKAYPMFISYDPAKRVFSNPVRLSETSESDHHFSPIIWADEDDFLHVLHGCHKTPGTYLVSELPIKKGTNAITWKRMPAIAPKLSYPTVYRIHGDKEVIYYRTDGHTSSWTYRISADNGRTWTGPGQDVTDLDIKGRLDWSSYQVKIPSRDGKRLHVAFTDYDDNKSSPAPQRFYNPRYDQLVDNEWKYNLSYLSIDLRTHVVYNADGDSINTPVDLDYSKTHCRIWDTAWRGAGIPPTICLDEKDEPTFLHILSGESVRSHHYYYVRREKGQWKQTLICPSNHQWNSGYLTLDAKGILHAYLIVGDGYLEGGYMDRHGGGRIEEWVSTDKGDTWKKFRDLTPDGKPYRDWRFNNIQPVVRPDGSIVEGMLLFYGWQDREKPEAKAFLLHE
ncbi:MAG: BNR-4 repeat-containing protein [Opitutales bacterium]|nr:BNR-4 repeat-containing protein [Opitutales bacterium]